MYSDNRWSKRKKNQTSAKKTEEGKPASTKNPQTEQNSNSSHSSTTDNSDNKCCVENDKNSTKLNKPTVEEMIQNDFTVISNNDPLNNLQIKIVKSL